MKSPLSKQYNLEFDWKLKKEARLGWYVFDPCTEGTTHVS